MNSNVGQGKTAPAEQSELIADQLEKISAGITKLRSGRLNERALLVLLHDSTNVSKTDISKILNGLEELSTRYLKPKPKKEIR